MAVLSAHPKTLSRPAHAARRSTQEGDVAAPPVPDPHDVNSELTGSGVRPSPWGTAATVAIAYMRCDRTRVMTAVAGIAFSYFLMVFQGGLFTGFLSAAGKVITASAGDLWISRADTPCIEFGAPMPDSFTTEVTGVEGVAGVRRALVAFTRWLGPDGQRRSVTLVASEPDPLSEIPIATVAGARRRIDQPEGVVIDESALRNLGIRQLPMQIEVNDRRATLTGTSKGFGTFLGAPYMFVDYNEAGRILGWDELNTMFIIVKLSPDANLGEVTHRLRDRYPELQVLSSSRFARQSGMYWMTQTGAGGGIALAGVLGILIGALIISQIMYAMTVERLGEFATIRAIGAPMEFSGQIVTIIALMCVIGGVVVGSLLLWPVVALVQAKLVAWLTVPWWLPVACLALSVIVAIVASRSSIRMLRKVDPASVFRS